VTWIEFGPEPSLAPDRPARALRRASVVGLGTALPDGVVGNQAIQTRLGVVEDDWIARRTGIQERRQVRPGESLTPLAVDAAQRALADADLHASELDLIVVATTGGDDILPNLAPLVAAAIGANGCAAYDLGIACTGFLAALSAGAGAIESRRADAVLVVGADALSRFTDPDDRTTAALFGDGAGAVVLGTDGDGTVGPVHLHSDGSDEGAALISIPRDDPRIAMDGHGTYRRAVSSMFSATLEAIEAADLTVDDIDCFVYHQANRRILGAIASRLEVDPLRVVDAIARTGNTSAASLPLALAQARTAGQLSPGARVLLGAAGAGFAWGAGVVTW
jgi:3-oxoacyl-[acyl-carrier-protein] synthase-3